VLSRKFAKKVFEAFLKELGFSRAVKIQQNCGFSRWGNAVAVRDKEIDK